MKTAEDLLKEKDEEIWSVPPATSVYEGLRLMAEKNIGALLEEMVTEFYSMLSRLSRSFLLRDGLKRRCLIESAPPKALPRCLL